MSRVIHVGSVQISQVAGGGIAALDLVEALLLPEFSTKHSQSTTETTTGSQRDKASCTLAKFRRTSQILKGLTRHVHGGYLVYVIKTTAELNECINKKNSFNGAVIYLPSITFGACVHTQTHT